MKQIKRKGKKKLITDNDLTATCENRIIGCMCKSHALLIMAYNETIKTEQ